MKLLNLGGSYKLEDVFIAGGQPSVTYVARTHLGIERSLKKALSQPSIIISLTGPTKSGKTVLCREVLEDFEYVWIEGGQIRAEQDLWSKICNELEYPAEVKRKETTSTQGNVSIGGGADAGIPANQLKFTMTAGGSRLKTLDVDRTYRIDSMQSALDHLVDHKICLVIDDFHYLSEETREGVIRAVKGAVYRGLKVVLLSTPHRAFEAIKAEGEITGRFKHVAVPAWSMADLEQIASAGFNALNTRCPDGVTVKFSSEAQGSPLLMQQFCWNLCYDSYQVPEGLTRL